MSPRGATYADVALLLVVVVLTICCGSPHSVGLPPHRTSLALGQRIGPVSYGEPRALVTKTVGPGLEVELGPLGEQGFRSYPVYGIYVAYPPIWMPGGSVPGLKRRTAAIVMTSSAQYKTLSGLGVGSSLRQLRRQISQLDCPIATDMSTPTTCQYGKPPATTVFTINPKTKRVTQIALVPLGTNPFL